MQPYTFTFPFDASGSPDNITLPQDFPSGTCIIRLKPPIGHAWTFYGYNAIAHALTMDEPIQLGPMYAAAGMVIGAAALDTGSGSGSGVSS